MSDEKLIEIIAGVLETDVSKVKLEENLKHLGWDSLADVIFISEIDDLLSVTLDAKELARAETGIELKTLVEEALAN